MIEMDLENRLSDTLEEAADGGAIDRRGEPERDPIVPIDPLPVVDADQNVKDLPGTEVALLIRERLEQHPTFRGRTALLNIEQIEETIVLSGLLPSHYLKQLLQELVRLIPDVAEIDNRVSVMRPNQ